MPPVITGGIRFFGYSILNPMSINSLNNIKCPYCGKTAIWEGNPFRPFCSERCRMVDLGAWVDEEYRIPGEEQRKEDDVEEL